MIKTVRWMDNYRPDLKFVSNSQDVKYIKEYLVGIGESRGFLKQFDSFFVQVGEGDYDEIWGMDGIVPHYEKDVYLLLSKSGTTNETQYARNPRRVKSNPRMTYYVINDNGSGFDVVDKKTFLYYARDFGSYALDNLGREIELKWPKKSKDMGYSHYYNSFGALIAYKE